MPFHCGECGIVLVQRAGDICGSCKVRNEHKKAKQGNVSAKEECPLYTLIVKTKTSKGAVVGKAEVKILKGGAEVKFGPTNEAEGKYDSGRVLKAGNYTVKVKRKCHKPESVEKANVNLPANDMKPVELTMDPYDIKISAKKASYTVVLDKDGNEVPAHPILEFEITDGPPNHVFDVQLSRDSANSLTGGPGLGGAWDKDASRDDRAGKTLFSSWTNGDTVPLDGDGKANYKMPLEWWRDLARIPLAQFDKKDFYYRVLAMDDAGSPPCAKSSSDGGAGAAKVEMKNNLKSFRVVDLGYINGGVKKSVRMEFKVREADTTEMYTIVQWNKGSNQVWGGARQYAIVTHYNIDHDMNTPEWKIDRLRTNPRYWDGNFDISVDKKTATATDKPGGKIGGADTHDFFLLDFDTKLHLNFEVPGAVTVTRQEGSAPIWGIVIGKLADPQPVMLANDTWNTRILQVKKDDGSVTVTHPNTYGGP